MVTGREVQCQAVEFNNKRWMLEVVMPFKVLTECAREFSIQSDGVAKFTTGLGA